MLPPGWPAAPMTCDTPLSRWLNVGAPPAQIAAWAGHRITAPLAVYAHCIDGQEQITNQQVEHASAPGAHLIT
jgi:hypothetical protein